MQIDQMMRSGAPSRSRVQFEYCFVKSQPTKDSYIQHLVKFQLNTMKSSWLGSNEFGWFSKAIMTRLFFVGDHIADPW